MKKIITTIVIFVGSIAYAQLPKEAKIKELMELTGFDKILIQGTQQFIDLYKEEYQDLPDEFWDEFLKEFSSDEFSKLYIPIYAKYYSETELDAIIKFYKTPVGQKTISNMPLVMKESMEVGREWGKSIGEKLWNKINKQNNDEQPSISNEQRE